MDFERGYLPSPEYSKYTLKDNLDQCKKRIESAISLNQSYRLIDKGSEFQIMESEPAQSFLKQLANIFAPRITIRLEPSDGITVLNCEVGIPKSADNIMRIATVLAIFLGIVPLWLGYGRDNPTIQQVCATIFVGFVVAAFSICLYARNRQNAEQDELRNVLTKLMVDLQAHAQEITRKPFPLKSALLFPVIIGFILAWWFGGYMYDVYKSQSWPSTQGTISESTETPISSSNVDKYETHYVYEYTVSDQHYVSERYAFEGNGNYAGSPGPYKVGEKVVVYYDPQNPQQALLQLTKFRDTWIIPVIIMAFAIVAVVVSRAFYISRV